MDNKKREHLINECKKIEENSTYTGDSHQIIYTRESRKATIIKSLSAITSTIGGFLILAGAPNWTAWIAVISGIVGTIHAVFDPERKAREHLTAAKNFTILKHESSSLYNTFSNFMDDMQYYYEMRKLSDKYNKICEVSPPTDDKSFEQARKKIKEGIHIKDFDK